MKKIFLYGEAEKLSNYTVALSGCGAQPVVSRDLDLSHGCDGLLLPGGADLDPALYGQENTASAGIDRQRDEAELELVRRFQTAGRPILGICKGFQVLNVALGGTLVQDLAHPETHRWSEASGDRVHSIRTAAESFLRPLYGAAFAVNSAHHQALDRVAPVLTVTAWAEDGIPEALQAPELGIFAVQFHPERMAFAHRRPDTVDGEAVFRFFLERV